MRKSVIVIVTALLGLLLYTGIGKYTRAEPIEHNLEASDVPRKWWDSLATIEMAGVTGLIVGIFWPPLMLLTCICLVLYFGGAVSAHIKAGDKNIAPSGAGMVLAGILAIVLKRGNKSID